METLKLVTNVNLYCVISTFFAFELQSIFNELFFQFLWLISVTGLGFEFRLRHGFLYCEDFSIGADSDSQTYDVQL